ncbi:MULTISPECIES: sigma-54-dependent Fis family transcriptional regulator [Acinetobacter]|uniref:sigma-54-dependent Fis family transcriptional regulator n=1 Tax=Acinetobacter TaxID=469 RepID=UPI00124F8616|nr:sigma 54-interacting transcriptional regulator [Acinetobacter oleivorans]
MDGLSKFSWESIKHNFYSTGELPDVLEKNSPIVAAWEKSRQAGLSPYFKVTSLKEFPIEQLSLDDEFLAKLAEPILSDIWQLFGKQEVSVFLINQYSKIIAEKHNPDLDHQYHFLQKGRVIDPSTFGAIAPTCSIMSKQPIIMSGHQHYLDEFSTYSCASVPIFNGMGQVLGALDITSRHGLLASNWLRHLLYQSYILENKIIFSTLQPNHRLLHFQHSKDLLDNAYAGLIVLDEHDKILKANQMALKLLNCSIEFLIDTNISESLICGDLTSIQAEDFFLVQSTDHAFFYACLRTVATQVSKQIQNPTAHLNIHQALKALQADIPVLITGETGTGKDHFAQELHQKLNPNLPFISINCGAIPEHLLESELFGYEGGAFTGAKKQGEKGLIELADQGILFLDEIGDLPLHLQVKILRVLQDQRFYRVGGRKPIKSAFKLVCATHQDLKYKIEQQLFRSDLYYRIKGYEVHLEPLRFRRDRKNIFYSILEEYGVLQWSSFVEQQFDQYTWPGNIRELIHVVKLSAVFNETKLLKQLVLPESEMMKVTLRDQSGITNNHNLNILTKQLIIQVLHEEKGNIAKTAKRLDISRTTVYKYLDS